jgi:hypothetical protein
LIRSLQARGVVAVRPYLQLTNGEWYDHRELDVISVHTSTRLQSNGSESVAD